MTSPNSRGVYIVGKKKPGQVGVKKVDPKRVAEAEKRLSECMKKQ